MLSVFNVYVYLVFACIYEYAAVCLDRDTVVKEIFNLNEFFFFLVK